MYMASDDVTIINEIESAIFNAANASTNGFIVGFEALELVRAIR
jgi:hypothetical protein